MPARLPAIVAALALSVSLSLVPHAATASPSQAAERATAVEYASTPIVVDGLPESTWNGADSLNIDRLIGGDAVSADDLSAIFKVMYTDTTLYVFVDVHDESLIADSGSAWWQDDSVEIYIDGDNSRGTRYDGVDDRHFIVRYNEDTFTDGQSTAPLPEGSAVRTRVTGEGYMVEMSFPLRGLGIRPASGVGFGLDLQLNDDDNGGQRGRNYAWNMRQDVGYLRTNVFGVATLGERVVAAPTPTATSTQAPTPRPTATATSTNTPRPTQTATLRPGAPSPTPGQPTPSPTIAATIEPPAQTPPAGTRRYWMPILVSQAPLNNTNACAPLLLTPPQRVSQAASSITSWYRFVASKPSYQLQVTDFPNAGSVLVFRVAQNRCAQNGTIEQELLRSFPLTANQTFSADVVNAFAVGTEYLIVVYNTGSPSERPFSLIVQ
jgi:hypothetical protein